MSANGILTVRTLKDHKSIVQALVASFRGRIADMAGDGILAEFSSALGALTCVSQIQDAIGERNAAIDPSRQMLFRIGINLGDIVSDDAQIYGDGINIAARLETLAEPGGICLSGKIHDEVQGKLDVAFQNLGQQTLKNISQPVQSFRISPGRKHPHGARPRSATVPLLSDKPSLAVLPFDAMGGDADLEAFADGLTEDIITGLSYLQSLWVIARNTVFTFKRRGIDVRTVASELGVRYVLEGSVRKAGDRLRMTAQLVEGETGHHIWAQKIDRASADLFSLQDEFTTSVVASVQTQLILIDGKARAGGERADQDASHLLGAIVAADVRTDARGAGSVEAACRAGLAGGSGLRNGRAIGVDRHLASDVHGIHSARS